MLKLGRKDALPKDDRKQWLASLEVEEFLKKIYFLKYMVVR